MSNEAREIFNKLSERLNLKCPRCHAVFYDYGRCNALVCAVPSCRAGFCAICLQDCGQDAHAHVREAHGTLSLHDIFSFERSNQRRAKLEIDTLMSSLSCKSFELQQLVRNHIDEAGILQNISSASGTSAKRDAFLKLAKSNFYSSANRFRLAILKEPEQYDLRSPINRDSIAPRHALPSVYRVLLIRVTGDLYRIRCERKMGTNNDFELVDADDIKADLKENPNAESLLFIRSALKCAAIAFEGYSSLYQSSFAKRPSEHKFADDEVNIMLRPINRDGSVSYSYETLVADTLSIIAFQDIVTHTALAKHIKQTAPSCLMVEPLEHLIGVGSPKAFITELDMEIPSQIDLNEDQRRLANPLLLKTAMEVAGASGSGKTKTIVELVFALLQCTNYDVVVLCERNNGLDALATKFKQEAFRVNEDMRTEIFDREAWLSVIAYGSARNMGESTKLFTVAEKIE